MSRCYTNQELLFMQKSKSWVLPVLVVALGLMVRIAAWAYWGTGTIESEGAEYAKIAENLRQGVGFVGLVSPGPQALFHPLYPWLIASTSFLVHDFELAGRLVSLVMGALLPLAVFGITSRLFNQRVGVVAGLLSALHPLSVYLSFMVYSEGPYATLFLAAIYLVVRALDVGSTRAWVLAGATFGLAYLIRAEAFAALGISMVFLLLATTGPITFKVKRAAYTLAAFLVFALPQIVFLAQTTGKLMLESKTRILFSYAGRRILAAETRPGVDYVSDGGLRDTPTPEPDVEGGYPSSWQEKWATYGIDSQLRGTGFAMRPWVDMARETQLPITDLLQLIEKGARRNIPGLVENLSSRWIGAPLLPALGLLGLFRRPWRGRRAVTRLYVLSVTAAPIMATLFVLWGDLRYYFIFVPLLCIWAANGLWGIGVWLQRSTAAAGWSLVARPLISLGLVPGVIGLVLVAVSIRPAISQYEFTDSNRAMRVEKEVGLWLKQRQHGPIRIMDLLLPLSFHAEAQQHVYPPYASGELALKYLDSERVDYIVLRRGRKFTKYYEQWLTQGIPDPRAELVPLPSAAASEKFVVYRWQRRDERLERGLAPSSGSALVPSGSR
jgi:hypothetical protein